MTMRSLWISLLTFVILMAGAMLGALPHASFWIDRPT